MYFVKYHPLKEQLCNRCLPDREALPYYVLVCALTAIASSFPHFGVFNKWDAVSGLIAFCVTLGGAIYTYTCNGGREGFDFIQKSIVLGWVVLFRCLLAFFPIAIALYIIGNFTGLVSDATSPFEVAIVNAFGIVFYQRLGHHLRDMNGRSANHRLEFTGNPQGGSPETQP